MKESAALALASDADLASFYPLVSIFFRQITIGEASLLHATFGE